MTNPSAVLGNVAAITLTFWIITIAATNRPLAPLLRLACNIAWPSPQRAGVQRARS